MKERLTSLVLCLCLTAAGPATAAPGARGESVRLRTASHCVLRKQWQESRQVALALPGSAEEAAAFTKVDANFRRCLRRQRLADTPEMRALFAGSVAERIYVGTVAWFRQDGKRTQFALRPPAQGVVGLGPPSLGAPPDARTLECAVARVPNQADRLLRSNPGSKAEAAAMAEVTAALPACLDRGQVLRMNPPRFRAEIARAFYRLLGGIRF